MTHTLLMSSCDGRTKFYLDACWILNMVMI